MTDAVDATSIASWVIALRGTATVLVLAVLVGGLPRVVQVGLAVGVGVWSAITVGGAGPVAVNGALWLVAARELVIGATIGVIAAVPLVAAATAGRLVDLAGSSGGARSGPFGAMFGVLAAAVFVGIDGHVAIVRAVVDSFASVPALGQIATAQPRVLEAIGALVPAAVTLAVPWLVTAAIVELAIGVGVRLATRAGAHAPAAVAVPAALVMMTATLVATLAVAIAALVRSAL
ncbi:MAG: flagellar biosynthetic protein FliR [Kofleriaceae bacterium]